MSEKATGEIMLNNVRLAFPTLWTPQRVNNQGEPRFSASLLMTPDHPDIPKLKKTLQRVAEKKWGAKASSVLKQLIAGDRICLHDGDMKPDYDGFPGNKFVSANSKVRPLAVDRDRTPLSEDDGRLYSGCYVNAKIDIWPQDNKYGKRLNAQLQGVQFVADGEAFAGGRPADIDEFAELEGVDEAEEFTGTEQSSESESDFDDILG